MVELGGRSIWPIITFSRSSQHPTQHFKGLGVSGVYLDATDPGQTAPDIQPDPGPEDTGTAQLEQLIEEFSDQAMNDDTETTASWGVGGASKRMNPMTRGHTGQQKSDCAAIRPKLTSPTSLYC